VSVDLGLVLHPPAREEGRQRELGEDHELRAARISLLQHLDQPLDHARAAVGAMDGAELGGGDFQATGHGFLSTSTQMAIRVHPTVQYSDNDEIPVRGAVEHNM